MSFLYRLGRQETPFNILSGVGLHGNEHGSTQLITWYLSELVDLSIAHFPRLSPSAKKSNSRLNKNKRNLNREFGKGEDDEAVFIEQQIKLLGTADLGIDWHEDLTETNRGYIYDVGEPFYNLELLQWQMALANAGIDLYQGIDDDDPDLQNNIVDGYLRSKQINPIFFSHWLIEQNICRRVLTIEVPGGATFDQKANFIEACFMHLILPAFLRKQPPYYHRKRKNKFLPFKYKLPTLSME